MHIVGIGVWATGAPSLSDWLSEKRDGNIVKPACEVVDARLRRGTSLLTRASIEATSEACLDAGLSAKEPLPIVFGSAAGEIQIAIEQLEMMRNADGIVSPARFRNSVHNTATGIHSITTGSTGFATAIAASSITSAMTLLEVAGLLRAGHPRVVCVVADEALPAPLDRFGVHDTLAIALVLESEPSARTKGTLSDLAPCHHVPRCGAALASSNCASPLGEVVRAVTGFATRRVSLGGLPDLDGEAWCVHVHAEQGERECATS